MMNPIFVTGAAGFIGSHTVEALLQSTDAPVYGIDDLSTGHRSNLKVAEESDRFRFIKADVAEGDTFLDLCRSHRPEVIIHLAGLVSVARATEEPELNYRLNVHATQLVAEAARRTGVKRVVFASSAAVYGDCDLLPLSEAGPASPISLYGSAKKISEEILRSYAIAYAPLAVTCLRYFNVFGPRQDPSSPYSGVISIFARRFAEGQTVTINGDGLQSRDFISIYDLARANAAAALGEQPGHSVCNICTGKSVTLLDLIDAFRTLHPGGPEPTFGPARAGDIRHSLGSPDAARRLLNFEATVSLSDGLADLAGSRPLAASAG